MSRRQEFLNNHLARVPVTANQQGTHELKDEALSSVGAQGMDMSGYQVSDLDDVELQCETDQLGRDAVFKPRIATPFSPSIFNCFEAGSRAENPIPIDEEQDKEKSPPHPTTPLSERPIQIPVLIRRHPFGTRFENVPDYDLKILFDRFVLLLLCMGSNKKIIFKVFHFMQNFFKN